MANIDWGTLAIGALIGVGCRKQLRAAAKVAATTAASLAGVAAQTAQQVAEETQKSSRSTEEAAAQQWLDHVDQQIAGQNGQANGQGKQG